MTTFKDPYEILGVNKDATEADIKKAFRQLARKYHPDNRETGNEDKFKDANHAYEILSDPKKRSIYDQYGAAGFQGQGMGGAGYDFVFNDLSDIFSEFFGGGFSQGRSRRRSGPERGSDLRYDLEIEFLEAISGCVKKINFPILEDCDTCKGTGAKEGSKEKICTHCNGQGEIKKVAESFFGHVTQIVTCPKCEGEGKSIEDPCTSCHGAGRKKVKKEIEVKVPCGVDEGARLRWQGKGEAGKKGGPPGDLYVIIHIKEHDVFERDDQNILLKQIISFPQAALGAEIKVPSVEGEKKLSVPPGIESYTVLKMPALGVPRLNNPARKGDQLVQIIIETPKKLSKEEKKLYEELLKLDKN